MHLQPLPTLVVQQLVIIRSQLAAALQLLLPHLHLAAVEAVAEVEAAAAVEAAAEAEAVAAEEAAGQLRRLF